MRDYINTSGVLAARDDRPPPANFPSDVTLLSGSFGLYNPPQSTGDQPEKIPLSDTTQHQPPPGLEEGGSPYITPEPFDCDGDEKDDHVSEVSSLTEGNPIWRGLPI